MELMRKFDIPVPRGSVATTPEEAEEVHRSHLAGGGEQAGIGCTRNAHKMSDPPPRWAWRLRVGERDHPAASFAI